MSIYKRQNSGVWWASYTDASGKRVRRSTDTADKQQAQIICKRWEVEEHDIKLHGKPRDRSFEEVILAFLKYARDNKRSYDKDKERARTLKKHFAGCSINQLTAQDIYDYIDARKQNNLSNATINRELSLFSAAINYCNNTLEWRLPNKISGKKLREPP